MITRLETRNFRMLRANSVSLRPFHVLVGQNATGKSTFLGALQFLGDLLRLGVGAAVEAVAPSFYDLCFDPGEPIALVVEIAVANHVARRVRYEIEIGIDEELLRVRRENLFVLPEEEGTSILQRSLFGDDAENEIIVHESAPRRWRKVVSKTREGRDYFRDEKTDWNTMFRFGVDRTALGSLPEDPERFPLSIAALRILRDGIRTLALDSQSMRAATPPGRRSKLERDGSNLPYVVRALERRDPILFEEWVRHIGLAVPGLDRVTVHERAEDKHLVLLVGFRGLHADPVPSWLLSDGTLRLMALTLLSYAATEEDMDVYLVEEPENGLHPLAIQVAYDALSQPSPGAQILCATHSPIFLAQTKLDETLVFRRTSSGSSVVRRGSEIPELSDWSGRVNLPDLFVTGVLA
ncbi:MAG TPA: ATP-binding protein [Thermoanaerobaculia bacterium]|jgi:predicted ATPase|nr:ATP-binding protein [Thermoanaerobaculia bacterium]